MLKSPAKLNLGLRIVGRRPDGYHLLESLFWPINFFDEISLGQSDQLCVRYDWAEDAPFKQVTLFQDQETLVGQLLHNQKVFDEIKTQILIKKRIPIGSGLGGISSNAGTLLNHFEPLLKKSDKSIESLALELGADVSFFLDPRPSWVTGIGEIINPLRLSPTIGSELFFILLLFPFCSSTPHLFSKYKDSGLPFSPSFDFDTNTVWDLAQLTHFLSKIKNDLEPIAEKEYPILKTGLEALRATNPIYFGLSGTGSTCFAVFANHEKRLKAAKEILSNCRQLSCKTVFAETF